MKKVFLFMVLFVCVLFSVEAKGIFFGMVSANYLAPADKSFKEIYSSSVFYPELSAGYQFYKDFYAYAGYGLFKRSGTTPELKSEAKTDQRFLSFGVGMNRKLGDKFEYFVSLGMSSITYREDALEETIKGSALGFRFDGSIIYRIAGNFFAGATLGYIYATDKPEDVSVKLGGFKAGLLLCFKLDGKVQAKATGRER